MADAESTAFWPELWHSYKIPKRLASGWTSLQSKLGGDLKTWGFWLSWYNGLLNGTPMDWPLIHKIALDLTDKDWDAGPEHVADRIRVIEAEYFSEKLPQAEEIEQDEEDGLFLVNSVFKEPEQLIDDVFRQLDFSIEIALRGGNTSGFDEMCVGFKYLDHTRKNCRDDPNGVHTNLGLARKVIAGNLQNGVYKEEDGLDALLIAIERHEIQLRGSHPEIRKANDIFVAQRLRELDEEKRLALAQEFRDLQYHTKDRLRDEFGLDAETLETDSGPEAQADSVKRSGGRTQEMALRAGELVKKMDGSASWKATGIGLRLSKIAELLAQIF